MGSYYDSRVWTNVPRNELQRRFSELVDDCKHSDGHGGYTGTFAEKYEGCEILDDVFLTVDEAHRFIQDKAYKRGPAYIVRAVLQDEPAPSTKVAALQKKLQEIHDQRRAVVPDALVRAKAVTSKTRGCSACGSSIAVKFLNGTTCPICRDTGFFLTKGDTDKIARLDQKIADVTAQIAAEAPDRAALIAKAKANPKQAYLWVVGAWCAS